MDDGINDVLIESVKACAELGYQPPVPSAPADQRDELQRQFLAAAADLSKLAARIAAL